MVVLPDADMELAADAAVSAGYGSAGERCMAISVLVAVGDVADRLLPKIRERIAQAQGRRPASSPAPRWARSSRKEHHARVVGLRRARARPRAPTLLDDGRSRAVPGHEQGFFLGPCLFDHVHARDVDLQGRDLRPGAERRARRRPTTRRSRSSTRTATPTASRSSPTTAAPRDASRTRSRSAWSASTCRSRCRWPTTRSAAGRARSSATPTSTAARASTSTRAARSSRSRWPDPHHRGVNLGFPQMK